MNDIRDSFRTTSPEKAFRYRRRYGGKIMLGEVITTEPVTIHSGIPILFCPCGERHIAIVKRDSLMEDGIAYLTEHWTEGNIEKSRFQCCQIGGELAYDLVGKNGIKIGMRFQCKQIWNRSDGIEFPKGAKYTVTETDEQWIKLKCDVSGKHWKRGSNDQTDELYHIDVHIEFFLQSFERIDNSIT